MTEILQDLYWFLGIQLRNDAPVLTGKTKNSIKIKSVSDNEIVLVIEPRYEDNVLIQSGRYKNIENINNKEIVIPPKYFHIGDKQTSKYPIYMSYVDDNGKVRKKKIGEEYGTSEVFDSFRLIKINNVAGERKIPLKYSYANDVNQHGGFFSENATKGWVNRSCKKTGEIMERLCGCEIIYKLKEL